MSEKGQSLTKGYEKCELTAYKDPGGVLTIGWGSTHYEDGSAVGQGDTITQEQADQMFTHDMAVKFEPGVRKRISRQLLQQEFDALTDLCYNAGFGYHDHSGTYHDWDLWHNVNNGMSGNDLFNYWTTLAITQAGVKENGLIRRRKSQVTLFETGEVNFFE